MKVFELINILQRHNPEATVVFRDRSDFVRNGLIRPLGLAEVQMLQLAEVSEDDGAWLCEWSDRPGDSDCAGPIAGLALGQQ